MKKITSKSPQETERTADAALKKLAENKSTVLALSGELGTGKTTLTKGLARRLGVKAEITSPTFLIIKEYNAQKSGNSHSETFKRLYHVDAYRLGSAEELENLKISEAVKSPSALVVIEWAEKVKEVVPESAVWINFKHGDKENERIIKIS